jgi:lysophospholipase L1-like esterase
VDSAWVWRYRRYINTFDPHARVINFAVGGYTTYDVMPTGYVPPAGRPTPKVNNNISAALAYRPNAIIVALTSNDAAYGYSVGETMANFDSVRHRSASAGVPIWFTSCAPRNISEPARLAALIATKDSILRRYAPRTIDVWNGFAQADGWILPQYNSGDGIHLNDAAHAILFQRVVAARIWETITSVERVWQVPEVFLLLQNFPNPFNPSTTISYSIPVGTRHAVSLLKVYDVLGRDVATLVDEVKPAGTYTVNFDASQLSSGVYYYKLTAGSFTQTKKMILAR